MSYELSRSEESARRFMLHAYTEWTMPARVEVPRMHLGHRVNRSDRSHHQTVSRLDGALWILTSHEGPFVGLCWWEMQRSGRVADDDERRCRILLGYNKRASDGRWGRGLRMRARRSIFV
jgi:hypothetical protein